MVTCTELKKKNLKDYCAKLLASFDAEKKTVIENNNSDSLKTASACFAVLTSKQFCYLNKARAQKYFKEASQSMEKNIRENAPIKIFLDIGGGYHAMVAKEKNFGLSNKIGFGELLLLRQMKLLNDEISGKYANGVSWTLVVDNLCAEIINEISTNYTMEYVQSLRAIIESLGLKSFVDVIAESEICSKTELNSKLNKMPTKQAKELTEKDYANVERFTGKKCDKKEATKRLSLYSAVMPCSEELLEKIYSRGIHLTQRHTDSTLCFRAFPGADVRIQTGIVAILDSEEKYRPVLLTTKNYSGFNIQRIPNNGFLPKEIPEIIIAASA